MPAWLELLPTYSTLAFNTMGARDTTLYPTGILLPIWYNIPTLGKLGRDRLQNSLPG